MHINRFYRIRCSDNRKDDAGDVNGNHNLAHAIAITSTLFKSLVEGTLIVVLYKVRKEHDDVILNSEPLKKDNFCHILTVISYKEHEFQNEKHPKKDN